MDNFLYKIDKINSIQVLNELTMSKFNKDSIRVHSDSYFLVFFGILFSSGISNFKTKNNDFLINLYENKGINFLKDLRGSFSGILQNKTKNEIYAFTNQIGDKQIFYYSNDSQILLSDSIALIVNYLKENNLNYTLDKKGAYLLLTYGFMLENYTLINEIRKLNAGQYIKIKDGKLEFYQYHRFNNEPDGKLFNKNEAIEGIDYYFRQAVKRQFDKDLEYGYKHCVSLSGGLDSRMTSWVAHEMGYTNQLNITFSQTNYLDETIPKQIASDLNHEWLFKALDNGIFLDKVDEITDISFGNILYYGSAHVKSLLEYINWDNLGIIHSGQLGDAIIGTFYSKPIHNKPYKIGQKAYSTLLVNKIQKSWLKYEYENEEIFKLYTRAFTGANQGLLLFQYYSETFSPFYDVDFLEFAYSIPVELRYNHYLYLKWMQQKYPEACRYWWEKTKNYPGRKGKSWKYVKDSTKPGEIPEKFLKAIVRKTTGKNINLGKKERMNTKAHMNPLNYWYNTNPYIYWFFNNQYSERFHLLDKYPEIKSDVEFLWANGDMKEKTQILTLLSALQKYFD